MKPRSLFLSIIIMVCTCSLSFSQEPEKRTLSTDSLQEEIIYEYDTVYIVPDTLHQTDTLILYKLRQQKIQHPPKPKPSDFVALLYGGGPQFYPLQSYHLNDSVHCHYQISEAFFMGISIKPDQYFINIQAGFEHLREKLQIFSLSHYTITRNNYNLDSAVVVKEGFYKNTYDCFSIEYSMGKKIREGKFPVYLFGAFTYKKLIQYTSEHSSSQLSAYVSKSSVRKDNLYLEIKPSISYIFSPYLELFVSPYAGFNLFDSYLHPYGTRIVSGLEINIKYFLKKK